MRRKQTGLSVSCDTTACFKNPRSSVKCVISFRRRVFFCIRGDSVSEIIVSSSHLTLKVRAGDIFLVLMLTGYISEALSELNMVNSVR